MNGSFLVHDYDKSFFMLLLLLLLLSAIIVDEKLNTGTEDWTGMERCFECSPKVRNSMKNMLMIGMIMTMMMMLMMNKKS